MTFLTRGSMHRVLAALFIAVSAPALAAWDAVDVPAVDDGEDFAADGIEPGTAGAGLFLRGSDNFSSLEEYYAVGTQPTAAELKGWWSGRCYTHQDRNTPIAAVLLTADLAGGVQPGGGEGGPLFPPSQPPPGEGGPLFPPPQPGSGRFKIAAFMKDNGPATAFDELSAEREKNVLDVLHGAWAKLHEARVIEGSVATYNANRPGFSYEWRVRKYQQYFMLKTIVVTNESMTPWQPVGATNVACYFFKQVRTYSAPPPPRRP